MSAEPSTENPNPDSNPEAIRTFLFTDIEGSTRLWEDEPTRMRVAMARHDALCREAVRLHGGRIVKSTGDGVHAAFDDPLGALQAALHLQLALSEPPPEESLVLRVRAGMHCGPSEARDGDYHGPALNRAARVMGAAHGGQTLVTREVAEQLMARLPPPATLAELGSVRLRDLSSAQRVWQLVHPRLRATFPPLRSLEATPNNLAQQLNSFVGRERELAEVRGLLAKTRLLTLLGVGGIGKSRLSVQLGAELLDEYPDGVWLVELAPLADARLVPQALANVFAVKEEGGATVLDTLLAYVRNKTLLVVLDNCEHLVHACAALAKQLLQAAPHVKVLATSRDALQVAGETAYAVPTLSVPATAAEVDPMMLSRHEAVRLFVERTAAVQPGFALNAGNAAPVAEICRRLDGIPLALELAAARTRALSVQAIASRLSDRFRLLVTGDQTVLPRQRTLRALIDWSFELLDEPERVLFRRIAVFAGGWSLEAAEAVGGGDGLDVADVLDLLARLVEKSLVVMEPGGGRYRMLETVRAYALEKLQQATDEAAARGRHVAHYLALAETARLQLVGPSQAEWLGHIDRERENLLHAHDWCGRSAACRSQGLQLVFVLKNYWRMRGLLGLGQRITVEALRRVPAAERGFERCRVLCDAGQLSCFLGRFDEARAYLEESHEIAREIDDPGRLGAVLQPLGMAYVGLGDHARALAAYESAVELARRLDNPRQLAAAMNALAQLHRADGALPPARVLFDEVLAIFRQLGDHEATAIAQLNRAMLAIESGDLGEAEQALHEVLSIASEVGSKPVEKSLLEVCAGLCAVQGDAATAARLYGGADAIGRATGIGRDANDEAFLTPLMQRARETLGAQAYAAAVASGQAHSRDLLAQDVARMLPGPGPGAEAGPVATRYS